MSVDMYVTVKRMGLQCGYFPKLGVPFEGSP